MANEKYTDVSIILDRSGSMHSIAKDTIGGFNTFIEEQKKDKDDKLSVSLYQFDNVYEPVFEDIDIMEVQKLTDKMYQPRGSTALYDAIAKTIDSKGEYFYSLPEEERPAKVIFLIITDGQENSSITESKVVADKITHQQEKYNWKFVFIGSDLDAILDARKLGISVNNSFGFNNTANGINAVYGNLSKSIKRSKKMSMNEYNSMSSLLSEEEKDEIIKTK